MCLIMLCRLTHCNTVEKAMKEAQVKWLRYEGICCASLVAWVESWNPSKGGRRERTSASWPLTFTCVLWYTHISRNTSHENTYTSCISHACVYHIHIMGTPYMFIISHTHIHTHTHTLIHTHLHNAYPITIHILHTHTHKHPAYSIHIYHTHTHIVHTLYISITHMCMCTHLYHAHLITIHISHTRTHGHHAHIHVSDIHIHCTYPIHKDNTYMCTHTHVHTPYTSHTHTCTHIYCAQPHT